MCYASNSFPFYKCLLIDWRHEVSLSMFTTTTDYGQNWRSVAIEDKVTNTQNDIQSHVYNKYTLNLTTRSPRARISKATGC